MKFKIHRGTQEIGGSCVEVWTDNTRILLDFGMPLVEKDGKEFDFSNYTDLTTSQLIDKGVLPDIKGLYKEENPQIDGIIISHAHQDHYGLTSFINPSINFHLGGYFGLIVPGVSVKMCQSERGYNNTKNSYCVSKIPLRKESPFKSIRWDEFTNRWSIASAMVPSPIMSYHTDTGICDDTMVDF